MIFLPAENEKESLTKWVKLVPQKLEEGGKIEITILGESSQNDRLLTKNQNYYLKKKRLYLQAKNSGIFLASANVIIGLYSEELKA